MKALARVMTLLLVLILYLPHLAFASSAIERWQSDRTKYGYVRQLPTDYADFFKCYTLADMAANHFGPSIYIPADQQDHMRHLLDRANASGHPRYLGPLLGVGEYSPATITACLWLPLIGFAPAVSIWLVLSALLLFITVQKLLNRNKDLTRFDRLLFWLMYCGSWPVWFNFYLGQSAAMLTAVFAASFFLLVFRSTQNPSSMRLQATLTALAFLIKPHHSFTLMAIQAGRRQGGAFVGSLGFIGIFFIAAIIYLGWPTVSAYPHLLKNILDAYDKGQLFYDRSTIISIESISQHIPRLALAATNLIGLASIFWLWRKTVDLPDKIRHTILGPLLVCTVLTAIVSSSHALGYDLMILGPAMALTLKALDPVRVFALRGFDRILAMWFIGLAPLSWLANVAGGWTGLLPGQILLPYLTIGIVICGYQVYKAVKSARSEA